METNKTCCDFSKIDLSKCNLDMTIRECLKAHGLDPEKVKKTLEDCCKKDK